MKFTLFCLFIGLLLTNTSWSQEIAKASENKKNEQEELLKENQQNANSLQKENSDTLGVENSRFKLINGDTDRKIEINTGKVSFGIKYSARLQTRMDLTSVPHTEEPSFDRRLWIRRARVKSSGYLFHKSLGYKFEADVVGNQILDAVIQWNFYKNFTLWVGQTKLPGNRERVISSQNLQFVDRSLLNKQYNIDRDKGIQLHHHFNIGNFLIREKAAVSLGEGKNYSYNENDVEGNKGYGFTGRLEFLPFGNFSKKGDYSEADLVREKTPKLSVGVSYDYNDNAIREKGRLGDLIHVESPGDLSAWYVDAMFKYNGFSAMGEYTKRTSSYNNPAEVKAIDDFQFFYVGTGLNMQAGYLFKKNWEIAARFTTISPEDEIRKNDIDEYTFALSKYIIGHKIKVQNDFSYQREETKPSKYIYRIQLELSF
ncbi:porin [Flexithrix dorotheae]|uniref:porin n=1 Tax=Flexithrix dorotheae TaxID=70993 RepID=UPI000378048A|nr:porin [Flexithrix dorotheae]